VFYEILTLAHPLLSHVPDPNDFVKWRDVHLSVPCADVRVARPDVPLPLAEVLLRMTDKSPGNRPKWTEILSGLNLSSERAKASPVVDSQLLAAAKKVAEERFREGQSRQSVNLRRAQEAERNKARSQECTESGKRLLVRFDEVIEAVNDGAGSSAVVVSTM